MRVSTSSTHRSLSIASAVLTCTVGLGCASVPDVSVSYRPVKWAMSVAVVHTLTCNRENNLVVIQRGATFVPIYSAAPASKEFRVQLKDLDRFFADSDVTLAFTDDGRLKSINQSTTGQGETVVKSAIAAAAALAAGPLAPAALPTAPPAPGIQLFRNNILERELKGSDPAAVCKVVRENSLVAADQLPQVSLVQSAILNAATLNARAEPSKDQEALVNRLVSLGLDLTSTVTGILGTDELQPVANLRATVGFDEVPLTLQRMVALSAKAEDKTGTIGSKSAPVPTTGVFVLPIPKAALFGKQSFQLVLTESGRISTLGYGKSTGVPGAFGAAVAAASAEVTEDNAEAAALKAAADLIAQQQRYNTCKLKPADCK